MKASLSDAQELAVSSTTNLEKHEAKHQMELENMKAREHESGYNLKIDALNFLG